MKTSVAGFARIQNVLNHCKSSYESWHAFFRGSPETNSDGKSRLVRSCRTILIGNYPRDGQQSMNRFCAMLSMGLRSAGESVEIWQPVVCFGHLTKSTLSGFGKWLGYLDKWILFPLLLRFRRLSFRNSRFHICDHSNSPYLAHLPKNSSSITCHDVLAIRGAMGFSKDNFCPASKTGRILQKWILANLKKASRIGIDSEESMRQLKEVAGLPNTPATWRVIHVGFNADFYPMERIAADEYLSACGFVGSEKFILHVGSSHPRKNRRMILRMVSALGSSWTGKICFAGESMDEELAAEAESLGIRHRVIDVVSPNHQTLVALYSRCEAFIFPSFSEGFGWPVIEAQACGVPVIATDVEPTPEVSGGAAIHASPHSVEQFVDAFLRLQNNQLRTSLVQKGFENCLRFNRETMVERYRQLICE